MRATLEAALANWRMPIPAGMEQAFREYQYKQNARFMRTLFLVGHLAFFSYVIVDYLMVPEIFWTSLSWRSLYIGVLLPLNLYLVGRLRDVAHLELMYVICLMMATILWLGVLLPLAQSEVVHTYMYASVIFVVVLNLVIRSCYRIAVVSSLVHWIIATYFISSLNHFAWENVFIYEITYLPILGFGLIISWYNTNTARRLFLHAQMEELDRSDLEAANRKLEQMAHTDVLTGLPNRLVMDDRLLQAITQAKRKGSRLALMYLDLDHFKPVNDTYGHLIGDKLLQQAARRMALCIRESDTVARIGGDEFQVLLPEIEQVADASRVAEKLRVALAQPFEVDGIELNISCSVGIAIFPEHAQDTHSLRGIADSALYRIKQSGRNNVGMGPA